MEDVTVMVGMMPRGELAEEDTFRGSMSKLRATRWRISIDRKSDSDSGSASIVPIQTGVLSRSQTRNTHRHCHGVTASSHLAMLSIHASL